MGDSAANIMSAQAAAKYDRDTFRQWLERLGEEFGRSPQQALEHLIAIEDIDPAIASELRASCQMIYPGNYR